MATAQAPFIDRFFRQKRLTYGKSWFNFHGCHAKLPHFHPTAQRRLVYVVATGLDSKKTLRRLRI